MVYTWLLAGVLLAFRSPVSSQSEKIDESVFQTALNATIFFYPTLECYKTMYSMSVVADRSFTAPFNTFKHATSLATPVERIVVLPNVDTLYSTAWLDLRAEPLILSVPRVTNQDGVTARYYSMQMIDAYTYNFAIVGSRTTGNDPQQFVVAGPNFNGCHTSNNQRSQNLRPSCPTGLIYQSKTDYVFLLGRTRVYNESDAKWVVQNIQPHYTLTGYTSGKISPQPDNLPPFPPINTNDTDPRDGRTINLFEKPQVFAIVNFILSYMNQYKGDSEKFEEYSEIGIGPGVSFSPILGDRMLYKSWEFKLPTII